MSYMCERITEVKGKRIEFMKDAEAYLHSVVDEEDTMGGKSSVAVLEMLPDGEFELECRANNLLYIAEGALLVMDLDTEKGVGIYEGDMGFVSEGSKIRCRTDHKVGCKCIVISRPPLKEVYPELSELFTGGQAKVTG